MMKTSRIILGWMWLAIAIGISLFYGLAFDTIIWSLVQLGAFFGFVHFYVTREVQVIIDKYNEMQTPLRHESPDPFLSLADDDYDDDWYENEIKDYRG